MLDSLTGGFDGAHTRCSRRGFLTSAAGSVVAMTACNHLQASAAPVVVPSRVASRVIFINLVGGPSQIDTWDPKPDADSTFRNFDPACSTSVSGLVISENLPRMAQRMHSVALVRSLHHTGPATHSAGQQLLMTGNCFYHNQPAPYFGSVLASLLGATDNPHKNVILGGRLSEEFLCDGDLQSSAWLPSELNPLHVGGEVPATAPRRVGSVSRKSRTSHERYGYHDLGRMCLQARRMIESGTRVVTINHFSSVYDQPTWDMHANGGRLNSTAVDYRETLCPQLDQALSGLLDDLSESGLLSETVVAVSGEMGRSPHINRYGGRDHHTGVWTGLLAGGPLRAGLVVGESDSQGESPASRPVTPAEFCATIYAALGILPSRISIPSADGTSVPALAAEPIAELL